MKILPVIMCGGAGTRVWPESRESLPKQFISLIGPHSTFQMVVEMLADGVFETPIVVSNHDYRFLVGEQLQRIKREARIVLEPVRRDSGPAVAVAAELAAQSGPDTIVAVLGQPRGRPFQARPKGEYQSPKRPVHAALKPAHAARSRLL